MLILTHENADFDAISSLWAAHRLYPESVPLLPWRINRNVNQFLTLYWDSFNFIRPEDWQRQRVDSVILVDTSSLPSVRGIRPDRVAVQVIDHHEQSDSKGPHWRMHAEPVGATTTLLVEELRRAGLSVAANEATLFLLGIHEDTGSLVYDTTSPRDAQAAAWLLEEGAQLPIVRRFLDIPLSEQQQQMYEKIQKSLEWLKLQGQSILLAAVDAPQDFDDEISAVAHRLRDALTPDGLFLLVQLKHNHVQFVARSSTDAVDVSVVARALGGGGHSRAAAATIMERDVESVRERLLDLLPEAIQSMATVAQIMSHGVQTVQSNALVEEAAALMQRSGHEGYPVVDADSGELVGLLTRRIVDRAVGHKLQNLPVSQIMKAGRVVVRASDSVEQVQRHMIREGWGQIPVVSDEPQKESEQLIGIVTRTDLIGLMTDLEQPTEEPDVRRLMSKALPEAEWRLVKAVSRVAGQLEMSLYFVGGLVRDLLLGTDATDIDMVVEGDAIALVNRLLQDYGGERRSHAKFGTAKWLLSPGVWQKISPGTSPEGLTSSVDFVTARTEFYTQPSALPQVERGSIKLDLHRRDFTINTLAIRLDGAYLGQLLDFYGGRRDLDDGLIRVLHSLSFIDDPTRILRAARLEQRLGFQIESRTVELITTALPVLDRVTGDRIRNELEMSLVEADPLPIMGRLAELGVLAQIHPGLTWKPQTAESFRRVGAILEDPLWKKVLDGQSPAFVYFALLVLPLSETVQREVMDRLKVRSSTREDIVAIHSLLLSLRAVPADARPSRVSAILRAYPPRALLVVLAATGADSVAGQFVERFQRAWREVRTSINGNDLLQMGLEAGPQIGHLLDRLLAARLDGKVADEAGEQALLRELLAESQPDSRSAESS